MSFGDPRWIWLLAIGLPAALLLAAWAARSRRRARARLMSSRLFERLAEGYDPGRARLRGFLFLLGVAAVLFALPRPQIGSELAEVKRRGLDVIVALDTSKSMLAEDLRPNRLEAAKRQIEDLFGLLSGNRLGLVSFAGESFTNMPLTLDASAARLFLDGVTVNTVPVPGTNLEKAVRRAVAAFRSEDRRFKVLVLVTDGEGHEGDAVDAARDAAEEGVVIFTVGIGTEEGHTVPLRDADTGALVENLRDREGRPVFSRLDRGTLQRMAAVSGGAYYENSGTTLDLDHLKETISTMETRELSGRQARKPIERYQWFLALGLLALALEAIIPERRGKEAAWTGRF